MVLSAAKGGLQKVPVAVSLKEAINILNRKKTKKNDPKSTPTAKNKHTGIRTTFKGVLKKDQLNTSQDMAKHGVK